MSAGPSTVVVDTNFVHRGQYRSGVLGRFARRLHARGFDVAVPEVVVWEWAEHVHRCIRDAGVAVDRARADVAGSGLALTVPEFGGPHVDDVVELIEADLDRMPGVRVVTATLADGAEAIRNQVLQVGVGSRRHGVKTGAAESLVLAAVERCAQDLVTDEPVVVCTNDARLGEHVARLEFDVHVARSEPELWAWFGTSTPLDGVLDDEIRMALGDEIERWFARSSDDVAASFPLFAAGVVGHDVIRSRLGLRTNGTDELDIHVHAVEDIDVRGVQVVDDDEVPRVVVADLAVLVDSDVVNSSLGEHGEVRQQSADVTLAIHVPVVVELDGSWSVECIELAETATASIAHG
jgi:hypothetical protein